MKDILGEIKREYISLETGVFTKDRRNITEPSSVRISQLFIKLFPRAVELIDEHTYTSYFVRLALFLESRTNRLIVGQEGGMNIPLRLKDIEVILGISKSTVKRFFRYCRERKIIARIDINGKFWGYAVNPTCALRGQSANYRTANYFFQIDEDFKNYLNWKDKKNIEEIEKLKWMDQKLPTPT